MVCFVPALTGCFWGLEHLSALGYLSKNTNAQSRQGGAKIWRIAPLYLQVFGNLRERSVLFESCQNVSGTILISSDVFGNSGSVYGNHMHLTLEKLASLPLLDVG